MTPYLCVRVVAMALALAAGASRAGPETPEVPADVASTGRAEQHILVMVRLPAPHFRPDRAYSAHWSQGPGQAARRRVADALASSEHLRILAAWPMPDIGVECFVMALPMNGAAAGEVLARLAQDPRVESAQAMQEFRTSGHNDPLFPAQPAARSWQLATLHKIATGRGVRVAVIDSGVDLRHPDLAGQVEASANVVDATPLVAETHGTAVAGIISARADDGIGIAGIAPGARLIALRACWETQPDTGQAQCNSFTLAKAIEAALDLKVDIINMSLSGPQDRLLGRLMDVALDRGMSIVGASAPVRGVQQFPASHPGVLAVACEGDEAANGTVLAPGHDVPAPRPGGRWDLVAGPSFAAAHVSGLLAMLRELDGPSRGRRLSAAHWPQPRLVAEDEPATSVKPCALLGQAAHACICDCDIHAQPGH